MKPSLQFRPAETSDSAHGAELIMLTMREFGDHFFGFGSHAHALRVVEQLFLLPRNRFSYQHATLACLDGQVVGLLSLFNAGTIRRAWLATGWHLFKVYNFREILKFTRLLMGYQKDEKVSADELYIAHLAVYPHYQRQGFGLQLLDHAAQRARAEGLHKVSLMTDLENQAAINLYHKNGYKIIETDYYPAHMHYLGSKGSVYMLKHLK